jgi:hypothetical protein
MILETARKCRAMPKLFFDQVRDIIITIRTDTAGSNEASTQRLAELILNLPRDYGFARSWLGRVPESTQDTADMLQGNEFSSHKHMSTHLP